ncbi:MAG: flagellar hook assembly protein FlgD [Deltaproteobacteria bacterium]|nr:flagellar hook assembly protein FlgD [Deltaproteobacteria bacterium]
MSTTAVNSATSAGYGAAVGPQKTLAKDDFLRLLLTQMQNQDPLSPVDNKEMLAQLAQFSSLEQMQGVSDRLDTLLLAQSSTNQLATTSLVGRSVSYRTDTVEWSGSGTTTLEATLSAPADVTVVIKDSTGKAVRTLQLGARPAGALDVAWDGKDQDGNLLPAGQYTISATGKTGEGASLDVALRGRGLVRGVTFEGSAPLLLIGGSRVRMSDVVEVIQA